MAALLRAERRCGKRRRGPQKGIGMKILAIDSSGLTATVALVEDDRTIAEYTVDYKPFPDASAYDKRDDGNG